MTARIYDEDDSEYDEFYDSCSMMTVTTIVTLVSTKMTRTMMLPQMMMMMMMEMTMTSIMVMVTMMFSSPGGHGNHDGYSYRKAITIIVTTMSLTITTVSVRSLLLMMTTMITYMTAGGHAVSVRHVHGADADAGRHQFGRAVDVFGVGLPALPRLLRQLRSPAHRHRPLVWTHARGHELWIGVHLAGVFVLSMLSLWLVTPMKILMITIIVILMTIDTVF